MKSFIKANKFRLISAVLITVLTISTFSNISSSFYQISNGISLFSAGFFVPGGIDKVFYSGGKTLSDKISYEVFHKGETAKTESYTQMV